jgi:hypothetical protein
MNMMIQCSKCKIQKEYTKEFFRPRKLKNKMSFEKTCRICRDQCEKLSRSKKKLDPNYLSQFNAKRREYEKKHRKQNPDYYKQKYLSRKDYLRKWRRDNYNPQKQKERHAKKMLNPTYRVSRSMSSRINQLIRDKEFTSVIDLLDYSIKELMIHLEKRFRDGMNWDNYGPYWHIDHIKPVSHFKFKSKNDFEFKECWALSNLQPLLKSENLSKGNRYIG